MVRAKKTPNLWSGWTWQLAVVDVKDRTVQEGDQVDQVGQIATGQQRGLGRTVGAEVWMDDASIDYVPSVPAAIMEVSMPQKTEMLISRRASCTRSRRVIDLQGPSNIPEWILKLSVVTWPGTLECASSQATSCSTSGNARAEVGFLRLNATLLLCSPLLLEVISSREEMMRQGRECALKRESHVTGVAKPARRQIDRGGQIIVSDGPVRVVR